MKRLRRNKRRAKTHNTRLFAYALKQNVRIAKKNGWSI